MILKTLIADTDRKALGTLREFADRIPFIEIVAECGSGNEIIRETAMREIDLIITETDFPDIDGIEALKTLANPPMVIYFAADKSRAIDSYRVNAVDFLAKPLDKELFMSALSKAMELMKSRGRQSVDAGSYMFIKTENRFIRVVLNDILYIKGYGEYLQVYVDNAPKPYLTLSGFSSVVGKLPDNFRQVHRSYVANMNRVDHVEKGRVFMDNGVVIPISEGYRVAFMQYLRSHTVGKKWNELPND